jgi:hypothetical protein
MRRITRRHMAAAVGALALGAAGLRSGPAMAESPDDAAIAQAVEALRKAMVDADKAKLQELTSDQLSYGHSSGALETKTKFVDVIASKKTIYKSITLTDHNNTVVGNNAIVRHVFTADTEADGKPGTAHIGVLQVWQKDGGHWKLLARQAFKI